MLEIAAAAAEAAEVAEVSEAAETVSSFSEFDLDDADSISDDALDELSDEETFEQDSETTEDYQDEIDIINGELDDAFGEDVPDILTEPELDQDLDMLTDFGEEFDDLGESDELSDTDDTDSMTDSEDADELPDLSDDEGFDDSGESDELSETDDADNLTDLENADELSELNDNEEMSEQNDAEDLSGSENEAETSEQNEADETDNQEKEELSEEEINEMQKAEIKKAFEKLKNGETLTKEELGNLGEMLMDQYYISKGYTPLNKNRVTSLNDSKGGFKTGIDGVYEKTNPDGSKSYVIADAKYNKSPLGDTNDGKQMSENWIDNRLDDAVGKEKADEIRSSYEDNPDSVSCEIYHIDPKVDENGLTHSDTQSVDSEGNKVGEKSIAEYFDEDGNVVDTDDNN